MTRSMTGFGGAQGQIGQSHYALEIRAVNGRYFKARVKLPEIWSFMEADIEKYLRNRLHRGSIQLTLRMKSDSPDAAYEVNTAAMERYLEQVEIIRPDQSDVNMTVDLATILQLPGVCVPPVGDGMDESACAEMVQLVSRATDALVEMRTTEGQAIALDLQGHCQTILSNLEGVRARAGTVVADYHQRLTARVAELVAAGNVKIDEQDLAREVAIFAERCDIAEELSRLTGHVEQFQAALAGEESPGRKLEFIAQEMLREANTIGAKANDGDIARRVVEIKTAVDRIKEQIQNVE